MLTKALPKISKRSNPYSTHDDSEDLLIDERPLKRSRYDDSEALSEVIESLVRDTKTLLQYIQEEIYRTSAHQEFKKHHIILGEAASRSMNGWRWTPTSIERSQEDVNKLYKNLSDSITYESVRYALLNRFTMNINPENLAGGVIAVIQDVMSYNVSIDLFLDGTTLVDICATRQLSKNKTLIQALNLQLRVPNYDKYDEDQIQRLNVAATTFYSTMLYHILMKYKPTM